MSVPMWAGNLSRKIVSRIVIEGDLILLTPAHLGSGDGDNLTDMLLLLEPLEGKPLLTGSTVAGALRSYLHAREHGYAHPYPDPDDKKTCEQERKSANVKLFGGFKGDDEGEQSSLIVDDALGVGGGIEKRSGVRINPKSRTAEHDALFDLQLWQAGTRFFLRFELLIREIDDANTIKGALATALQGFNDGSITLGARKRRGYGRVKVENWRIKTYDLTTSDGLINWIENGDKPLEFLGISPTTDIVATLGVGLLGDIRQVFRINATFSLDGSILIRSGGGKNDIGPDMVHLHAKQTDGSDKPIISGTSLGGVLRARALKIAQTIGNSNKAHSLIHEMFGPEMKVEVKPWASRVFVEEHVVKNARTNLVQNRVGIDRFTGGARETALFNEQPAFGGSETTVTINLSLVNPKDHEIGLLLLLLKDLWTSDLPIGGESSVGRGRLKGVESTLIHQQTWSITAIDKADERSKTLIVEGDRDKLQSYVKSLHEHLKGESA